jgi:hypothetical protein
MFRLLPTFIAALPGFLLDSSEHPSLMVADPRPAIGDPDERPGDKIFRLVLGDSPMAQDPRNLRLGIDEELTQIVG